MPEILFKCNRRLLRLSRREKTLIRIFTTEVLPCFSDVVVLVDYTILVKSRHRVTLIKIYAVIVVLLVTPLIN